MPQRALNYINSLCIFSGIMANQTMQAFQAMLKALATTNDNSEPIVCTQRFQKKLLEESERLGLSGNLLKNYILHAILEDENIFSLACERKIPINGTLKEIVIKDLNNLIALFDFTHPLLYKQLSQYVPLDAKENIYINKMSAAGSAEELYKTICGIFQESGCGILAKFIMFRLSAEGQLIGVQKHDLTCLDDIVGYENQKMMLCQNTEKFLNGYPANNILLVGARGTGKSSCVKAMANTYYKKGLRLLELTKDQMHLLPALLNQLEERGLYFIVFIDDLSFEEFEVQYKYMKSVLEGGVQVKPHNVLFYATSNRRNLIQEKWSDRRRGSEEEEVHAIDALNEKVSLSDRFGLTIVFPKPTPQEYITIALELAKKENIEISEEELADGAKKWELSQNSLSGRTAKQFINHIKGDTHN